MSSLHDFVPQQKRLRPLEIENYYGLKGLDFAIANVGTVAPLLHGLHRSGRESSVAFDEADAGNFAGFINHFFENNGSLGTRAGIRRIFRCNAVGQALLGTFRRENDSGVFPGQRGL
jgi:hypothetical protein